MFAGVAVMIVMIPVNGFLAARMRVLQKRQMLNKDGRMKLMDEILCGIKVIKLYAWFLLLCQLFANFNLVRREKTFLGRVTKVRESELSTLRLLGYQSAIQSFTWTATPFFVAFATFALYSFIGDSPLTASKIFVAISLFNLLQFPLAMFPMVISSVVEASVALNRIHGFLVRSELNSNIRESSTFPRHRGMVVVSFECFRFHHG